MSKEKLAQLLGSEDIVAVKVGSEKNVEELWNASHDDKYELRGSSKWKYPIDEWFGVIVNDEGVPKLVSIVGYSLQDGKGGKKFAFVGGAKTHPNFTGRGYMRKVRDVALSELQGIVKVGGFSTQRKKSNIGLQKPETHDVVPDEIIEFMKERIDHLPNVDDWGIYKSWFNILKRHR